MDTARLGFILMFVGFPLYLLWKGRLPAYIALMQAPA